MKIPLLYILFILIPSVLPAQDKTYMTDGSCKTGTIVEIGETYIINSSPAGNDTFPKSDVVLIDFKNSPPWIINRVREDVIVEPQNNNETPPRTAQKKIYLPSDYISLNTIALCNADIAGFYEHLLPSRQIGFGAMAAYNFNPFSSGANNYLAILENAKKKYDIGVFANFYLGNIDEEEETVLYFGAMMKYLRFDFTKVTEANVQPGASAQLLYTPATGSQLATLLVSGTHSTFKNNLFIKSLIGLGGFNLHGDYRQQFNYMDLKNNGAARNVKFLLKLYLGINIGIRF